MIIHFQAEILLGKKTLQKIPNMKYFSKTNAQNIINYLKWGPIFGMGLRDPELPPGLPFEVEIQQEAAEMTAVLRRRETPGFFPSQGGGGSGQLTQGRGDSLGGATGNPIIAVIKRTYSKFSCFCQEKNLHKSPQQGRGSGFR